MEVVEIDTIQEAAEAETLMTVVVGSFEAVVVGVVGMYLVFEAVDQVDLVNMENILGMGTLDAETGLNVSNDLVRIVKICLVHRMYKGLRGLTEVVVAAVAVGPQTV